MCLSGEYELHGELLVVDDACQTVEVGEQQVCALVGGEAACEAYDESVGIDFVDDVHHCGWITLVGEPFFLEVATDEVDELVLELYAHVPDFFIGNGENAFPCFGVALVFEYLCTEFLHVEFFPFGSCPGGHVHAVGDVAYVAFFPRISFPDAGEHFLGHFTMEPAYAICFLACVEGEYAH